MGVDARAIGDQNRLLKGKYDFSEHGSVSNAAAPGDLIRETTEGYEVELTDVIVYNAHAGAAVITFYDEDSNIKLVLSLGNGETAALEFRSGIKYGTKDVYARTDMATNAEITISGKEVPLG